MNVLSPFLLTNLLLENMRDAVEPRIIITSSISQSSSLDWENLQVWLVQIGVLEVLGLLAAVNGRVRVAGGISRWYWY